MHLKLKIQQIPLLQYLLFILSFISCSLSLCGQIIIGENAPIDYTNPKEYEIGGITISGIQFLDESALITLSGLEVGDKILVPGEEISRAIENLWKQSLFSDIKVVANKVQANIIFIEFRLQERPRLSHFTFKGVNKSEADKLREEIKLVKGKVVTENLIKNTTNIIKNYFAEKGFLNAEVQIDTEKDSALANGQILHLTINKKQRVKINAITFTGNKELDDSKLKRTLKDTKEKNWYHIFASSKFIEESYEQDKQRILDKYNSRGFRDVRITKDSIYKFDEKTINIDITIHEGKKYYFRNINWIGNTKYTTQELNNILAIKRGDVFDQSILEAKLYMNPSGRDISSLYLDDGYLFFQVTPIEVLVENDSIDIEMRVYEGKQAIINNVTVSGNTKTNDRVIRREIRTRPGQLFSRSDIIRTQRELAQLGYFDPEKLNVNPQPNPTDGTVDIEYIVEEKPSDQLEVSGGYGANQFVGSAGFSFNNFSARNLFNKEAWRPLPSGDGQRLSFRVQGNGPRFQSYNISFTEPWLGGKKPNSLSVTTYYTVQNPSGRTREDELRESIDILGISLGLGKRLKVPDDYFTLYQELNFQHYILNNYTSFLFTDGYSNNFNLRETFARNSIDQPIFPRQGSSLSLTLQLTPPYSLFEDKDYASLPDQEKYRWAEYHKWKFDASWFTKVAGNLVLNTRARFGFLGSYNQELGPSPFERFYVGGDGLSGYSLIGEDIVALRGYENRALNPGGVGGTVFDRYTFELRYPVSLNPSATIYGLVFAEGGNAWLKFKEFNPFSIKRSAGFGIRIFLPMIGLLGFDFGYGFDDTPGNPGISSGWQTHFSIGGSID